MYFQFYSLKKFFVVEIFNFRIYSITFFRYITAFLDFMTLIVLPLSLIICVFLLRKLSAGKACPFFLPARCQPCWLYLDSWIYTEKSKVAAYSWCYEGLGVSLSRSGGLTCTPLILPAGSYLIVSLSPESSLAVPIPVSLFLSFHSIFCACVTAMNATS